jgi:hypothetical protein
VGAPGALVRCAKLIILESLEDFDMDQETLNKLAKVFRLSFEATKTGTIEWAAMTDDLAPAGVFEARTAQGYRLKVYPFSFSPDENPAVPSFAIQDQDGKLVYDITYDAKVISIDDLRDFYSVVENSVTRLDDKLAEIIADLSSLPKVSS